MIVKDGAGIGFAHLGSRGAEADWLEDLFVLPDYQNRGIGACAVGLLEDIVKQYSDSFYIEAAARNEGAIRLYHKLGYNGLNTITIRKGFSDENYNVVRTEQIHDRTFEIRRG